MDEFEIEPLEDAPAPVAASLRSARITDDPIGVAEPLCSSRGNPASAEGEVALAMLEMAVKDCLRFMEEDAPSKLVLDNAISAAGWLFGPAGELACDAFLGETGRDRVLALVRQVKRRVLADFPAAVGIDSAPPVPASPGVRWVEVVPPAQEASHLPRIWWALPAQLDLFPSAA